MRVWKGNRGMCEHRYTRFISCARDARLEGSERDNKVIAFSSYSCIATMCIARGGEQRSRWRLSLPVIVANQCCCPDPLSLCGVDVVLSLCYSESMLPRSFVALWC